MKNIIRNASLLTSTILASTLFCNKSHAVILSLTGSGELRNSGDLISGVIELDTGLVDYTLTLNNINGLGRIGWNGGRNSDIDPNPGLTVGTGTPTLGDTMTVTFEFSQKVNFNWVQSFQTIGENQGASNWNFSWLDATSAPTILDPDNQLQDELTSVGNANFRISTNPGVGSTRNGGTVSNSQASWFIDSPSASQLQITWSAAGTDLSNIEYLAINGNSANLETVPEPITIFGTLTALGFGTLLKRHKQSN